MKFNLLKSLSLLDDELDDMGLTQDDLMDNSEENIEDRPAKKKVRRAETTQSLYEKELIPEPVLAKAEEASQASVEKNEAAVMDMAAEVPAAAFVIEDVIEAPAADEASDLAAAALEPVIEAAVPEEAAAVSEAAEEEIKIAPAIGSQTKNREIDHAILAQETIIMEPVKAAEPKKTRAYLVRKKTGEIIAIDRDSFILGTLPVCCDYVIGGNDAVSRIHAVIKYEKAADQYIIADCISTNHTYIDGTMLASGRANLLRDSAHIHLASEEFIFNLT